MFRDSDKTQKDMKYAQACLIFAKRLGLIEDDSLEAVKQRCQAENDKRAQMLKEDAVFYGLTNFSFREYLEWDISKIKLDFVSESEQVKKAYSFREIPKKEIKAYYKNNRDLFTRYNGDRFPFRDLKQIIRKRIREEEFENEIKNILRQLD